MRSWLRSEAFGLLVLVCAAAATAQNAAPQRDITVVVNVLPPPAKPVKAASVSLWYLDNGTKITEARQVTNSQGQAELEVSADVAQRGDLRIEITGAGSLAIYEPAGGQFVTGFAPSVRMVTVSMLPVGSPALLGPTQIQAYLNRSLKEVTSLRKQVSGLKGQAAQAQSQEQALSAELAGFAGAMGFSADQVSQQIQVWAQNVQLQADQATAEQKALAEFALKEYAAAARDFNQAGDATEKQIDAEESAVAALEKAREAAVDQTRDGVRQLIDQRQQAAAADQLSLQYHEATQTLERALTEAEAEDRKHPGDQGFHQLWIDALWDTASARLREGEIAEPAQGLQLLAKAGDDFGTLAHEYTVKGDRAETASAESNVGVALCREGERAAGEKGIALLAEAAKAYRSALEVYSKAATPQDWASTESNLGVALDDEGQRTPGDAGMAMLEEAVQAYQSVLEVRTKAALPHDWAETQNNLANALRDEGLGAAKDKAMGLLDQALEGLGKALEVFTKADFPMEWAAAEMNRGNVLADEGERASDDKAMGLLEQAVQAEHNAMEIYTKSDLPQYWAMAQDDLGRAMEDEGENAQGEQSVTFLDAAVTAYRSVLEVRTEADLPRDWAMTENSLGYALRIESTRVEDDKAVTLLEQAVEAYRKSLEVRTRTDVPDDWANTQINLGIALRNEGVRTAGAQGMALLEQAVQAYKGALEVYTRGEKPQDWADTQEDLGIGLRSEGERASGDTARAFFEQAAAAFESALEVDPNDADLLDRAGALYHDRLFRFDRALELDERLVKANGSASNRMDLMEGALTAAHFDTCMEQMESLSDSKIETGEIPVRDVLDLACAWGAGDRSAAPSAEDTLKKDAADAKKSGWDFTGTLHFISESAVFAKDRAAWMALFTAVQNGDRAGIATALEQLEAGLRSQGS